MIPKNNHFKAAGTTLDIIQFTEEVYFALNPNHSEEDYLKSLDQDEREMVEQWEKLQDGKVEKIRRVIVDEQYLYWLGKNKKRDNALSQRLYMAQVSDEDVVDMWEKEFGTNMVESHFIPVTILTKEGFYIAPVVSLPTDAVNEFKKELAELWKENGVTEKDIIVVPELLDAVLYSTEEERMVFQAFEYFFMDKELPTRAAVKTGPKTPANLGIRYMPIFIKRDNKAILTGKELELEYLPTEIPEDISDRLTERVKDDAGTANYDLVCNQLMIPAFQYEDYYNDFTDAVEREVAGALRKADDERS